MISRWPHGAVFSGAWLFQRPGLCVAHHAFMASSVAIARRGAATIPTNVRASHPPVAR